MTELEKFIDLIDSESAAEKRWIMNLAKLRHSEMLEWLTILKRFSLTNDLEEDEIRLIIEQLQKVVDIFRIDQKSMVQNFANILAEISFRLKSIGGDFIPGGVESIETKLDRIIYPDNFEPNGLELEKCHLIKLRDQIAENKKEIISAQEKHAMVYR